MRKNEITQWIYQLRLDRENIDLAIDHLTRYQQIQMRADARPTANQRRELSPNKAEETAA